MQDWALVMSGGGARSAYQAGLLMDICEQLPQLYPRTLTGVSAGAINVAHLASRTGDWRSAVEELNALWRNLEVDQILASQPFSYGSVAAKAWRLLRSGSKTVPTRGLVSTAPLHRFLSEKLGAKDGELARIGTNLQNGSLHAVAVTGSCYATGQSVTWVQGAGIHDWERAQRISLQVGLRVEHIMASAALPALFPAVQVDGHWYGDGGIRLTAPLAPAVHLGARKILALSTRFQGHPRLDVRQPIPSQPYPGLATIAGSLLNAVFLDQFDADALRLRRINKLLDGRAPEAERNLHPIELLVLRPSEDLGKVANQFPARLPKPFGFLTKEQTDPGERSNDLLSLVMFQPDYLQYLVELGRKDARLHAQQLADFFQA